MLTPITLTPEMGRNSQEKRITLNFGLDIAPHEIVSLVAPSGAGKTTFMCNLLEKGIDKQILFFALEETRSTMADRIIKCSGEDQLRRYDIIDQSDLQGVSDDFEEILETITEACSLDKYGAIVIDHLTCIATLKKHKNAINLLKQPTVTSGIPLFIINQYRSNNITRANCLAGGEDTIRYATLTLSLNKKMGKVASLSEDEQVLLDIDITKINEIENESVCSLDEKRNLYFKSPYLRLLKLEDKNRYNSSFVSALLDFDVEHHRYIPFDRSRQYTEKQKKIIIRWNTLCARIMGKDYIFDENNATCYKIESGLETFVGSYFMNHRTRDEEESKRVVDGLKEIFTTSIFMDAGIQELNNIISKLKTFVQGRLKILTSKKFNALRKEIIE